MDIEKIARAIETDAGMTLDELRQGLAEMQAGCGRVTTEAQLLVRSARAKTGLSQQAFAERILTPVATLRDWEQGRFTPPGGVLCLLKLIGKHPNLIGELNSA
ncbi:MAG: helix-turn-helix domain-containing protein [Methylococcaceae bacterium]|jgi:putative transcriptional regulator